MREEISSLFSVIWILFLSVRPYIGPDTGSFIYPDNGNN